MVLVLDGDEVLQRDVADAEVLVRPLAEQLDLRRHSIYIVAAVAQERNAAAACREG